MKILGVDPSSTCIGWGLVTVDAEGNVAPEVLCGKIKRPTDLLKNKWEADPAAQQRAEQIVWMEKELWAVIHDRLPVFDFAVVEWPSPATYHGGKRQHRNASGLQIYGAAAGAVFQGLALQAYPVIAVTPEVWTQGQSKQVRQQLAAQLHVGYDSADDRGCDISDALCLAGWYGRRLVFQGLTRRPPVPVEL